MASSTTKTTTTTTTLMTFLVKAPPSTQSVHLLGSWDNFSKPYRMKRDTRLGAEHWTGCYTFENIICDGNVKLLSGTRQGGLKMGGTYWYYYQLDGNVDYHNPAEPSTSSCPMLPGQVVNVLNVPMYFSGSHHRSRNASVSSTSSDLRTMNPADRYLNPRPAPNPTLTRLDISAPQELALNLESSALGHSSMSDWSSHHRDASLPVSAISLRSFRLPRKYSMDRRGRSASPVRRATGLKAALRQLAPSKARSPETSVVRDRHRFPSTERERLSLDQPWRSDSTVANRSLSTPRERSKGSSGSGSLTLPAEQDLKKQSTKTLALQQGVNELENVEDPLSNRSFQNHRRQRSRSREPLPLQNSSHEEPKEEALVKEGSCQLFQPLETVTENISPQNTPIWSASGAKTSNEEFPGTETVSKVFDKHLPAVPNTASECSSDEHHATLVEVISKELSELQGNVSGVTVSDNCPSPIQSQFSRWTGTTASSFASSQWSSVFFDNKSPSFTQSSLRSSQLISPYEKASSLQSPDGVKDRQRSSMLDGNRMPSIISSSTISSYENTSPSSPDSASCEPGHAPKYEATSLQKRYGMMISDIQRDKFPLGNHTSEVPLTCQLPFRSDNQLHPALSDDIGGDGPREATIDDFQPSTSMQKLMAELSYLGDMIQR